MLSEDKNELNSFYALICEKLFNLFLSINDESISTKESLEVLEDLIFFISDQFRNVKISNNEIDKKQFEINSFEKLEQTDQDDINFFRNSSLLYNNISLLIVIILDVVVQVIYDYLLLII